jgi:predicted transcriptional regulator
MATKTSTINVRVSDPEKLFLQELAEKEDLDLSDIVRRALKAFKGKKQAPFRRQRYGNT